MKAILILTHSVNWHECYYYYYFLPYICTVTFLSRLLAMLESFHKKAKKLTSFQTYWLTLLYLVSHKPSGWMICSNMMLFLKYYNTPGSIILECQTLLRCFVKKKKNKKNGLFYPDSINMEKKFPQMPVSIPSIWKTILKDSLKLTISAPDQIHFWNPIQYLQELYGLHRTGFLAAISRMRSEQNLAAND